MRPHATCNDADSINGLSDFPIGLRFNGLDVAHGRGHFTACYIYYCVREDGGESSEIN